MGLAKRIIPCLDVDRGRVVKGVKFVGIRDAGDPVEIARRYDEQGADELVFLDITASSDQRDTMIHVVEQVAAQVFIPLTVGGGIRSITDIRRMLNAGADKVAINTAAIQHPELVKEAAARFGSQCIVLAIDAKRANDINGGEGESTRRDALVPVASGILPLAPLVHPCTSWESEAGGSGCRERPMRWEVFTHGGRKSTGIDVVQWAKQMTGDTGAGEILLTSMDRDGTRDGFDLALIRAVSEAVSVPVIASGGVGNLDHLADGVILGKADAVLAASIFHFCEYTVAQARQRMAERGIEVRAMNVPFRF